MWHEYAQDNGRAVQTPYYCTLTTVSLPGGELLDRVAVDSSWTEGKASGVVKRLLETLQHVHSLGIIHMDIKVGSSSHQGHAKKHSGGRVYIQNCARCHDAKLYVKLVFSK